MDEVFRAINDPSRRRLLDALFDQDGQTLSELVALLPEMTRYGVMSHLRVLEASHLVTTRKSGRSKYHYLNPVPIRLVHDRWISRFAEPTVGALSAMKTTIEGATVSHPTHIYTIHIAAPVAEVWKAITDPTMTARYFYSTRVDSTWEPGTPIRYLGEADAVVADGEILVYEEERRVEMMFHAKWDPELEAEGPVWEAWIVEDAGATTALTVEMYDVDPASKTFAEFTGSFGFPYIVSGLKTVVETGETFSE